MPDKTDSETQKDEVTGDRCVPAEACWVQPAPGDVAVRVTRPLTARWPVPRLPRWPGSSSGTTQHNGLETGGSQAAEEC